MESRESFEAFTLRSQHWTDRIRALQQKVQGPIFNVEGKLTRMVGLTLEAVGCQAPVGARCLVIGPNETSVEAEVVGFSGEKLYLMATGDIRGITPNARVLPTNKVYSVPVGDVLLGRVLSGTGVPLDGLGNLECAETRALSGHLINPLLRSPIREPLDVGVRTINALMSVGRGQRMGLFAGSGVGKSVLLGMMTRFTNADIVVVGLIGERGREVKEFIENILGTEGMKKAVIVAAPADDTPMVRLHGASLATTIAEYYRDKGKNVLLLMDSLTRYAQAQREIGLAIGEPPATKGYPPSVFAKIPQLVERAGNGPQGGGSITAFYTVLTEGDDNNDPIADAARAILDGHVVLSRELAESGLYPAIDVEASISRAMTEITTADHQVAANMFKKNYSTYRQNRDLISVGAYQAGADPDIDKAIALNPKMREFLQQNMHEAVSVVQSVSALKHLLQLDAGTPNMAQLAPETDADRR
ncbi:MAG: flagellar protein export ATPase FliI [Gammaproteobacteria bacterium]|nr:flagellar protein export ATPase FliI [Gammaproteobacteria bacterium]MDH5801310.1 flagellar protein export ATPase FliI [Gammaproteobacteria bacterium]